MSALQFWMWVFYFGHARWFRKWCGGHWELWYVDFPVCSRLWLDMPRCHYAGHPTEPLLRGTPLCEDWR